MTDHTPTPWAVHKTAKAFSISAKCGCGRGEGIASVYGSGNNKTNGEANAEFIVRAVNRDHAFEGAIRKAAERLSDMADNWSDTGCRENAREIAELLRSVL